MECLKTNSFNGSPLPRNKEEYMLPFFTTPTIRTQQDINGFNFLWFRLRAVPGTTFGSRYLL